MKTQWLVRSTDESAVACLVDALNIPALVARVLVARGISDVSDARLFLAPDLERDWHDPFLIPGMSEAVEVLVRALRAHQRIMVFGDFDVDGISATAVLAKGLPALGAASVETLIPRRDDEGYGLSDAALTHIFESNPDLLITVDCGITGQQEVARLREAGISVIVTDHHEPSNDVPQGIPVVDPKLDSACPSFDLAGVGVALKLICALGTQMGYPDLWRSLTDFAMLGTVSDRMRLLGENRALVADGLVQLYEHPRAGIAAALTLIPHAVVPATAVSLSFGLIPRLNAAGRMLDAQIALDLLLCEDPIEGQVLAARLEAINDERRAVEAELADQAFAQAEKFARELRSQNKPLRCLVLAHEGWHEGVKGIVASRVASRYGVPTLLCSIEGGEVRGSGRSSGSINLFQAVLTCCQDVTRFGGHTAAVGVTIPLENLEAFRTHFEEALALYEAEDFSTTIDIDAEIFLEDLIPSAIESLSLLEPFGQDNPEPLFVTRHVFLNKTRLVGAQQNHLVFEATDGIAHIGGIYFQCGEPDRYLSVCDSVDILYRAQVDEWRGTRQSKMYVSDMVCALETVGESDARVHETDSFLDDLFARGDSFSAGGRYATIAQASVFHTKVAGVTFEGRQEIIAVLTSEEPLRLVREPGNVFDPQAVAVMSTHGQVGYLNRELAMRIAPVLDGNPTAYVVHLDEITGRETDSGDVTSTDLSHEEVQGRAVKTLFDVVQKHQATRSLGVNLLIEREEEYARRIAADTDSAETEALLGFRHTWESYAVGPTERDARAHLTEHLVHAMLPEKGSLHSVQCDALYTLASQRSTLVIMATGRGKSLIFHIHAARIALMSHQMSIFVFPLRALIADQAFHLTEMFAQMGLRVVLLTGELHDDERARHFEDMACGRVDIVLTTPEFLAIHGAKFGDPKRVGFLVIDEAHHIGQSKAGHRPAYSNISRTCVQFPHATVLAVTATADDEIADTIVEQLGIEEVLIDPTVRENLLIDDKRTLKDRSTYLASIASSNEKAIVYVNSRDQSIKLARELRKRVPHRAAGIGFYNAGMTREDRKTIEELFRTGSLRMVISTSAFGEGVNIPDIRHVILYHLPFNQVEFNQMAGRAGRDGKDATIHLLFGAGDGTINQRILSANAPERSDLIVLYKVLRSQYALAALEQRLEFFNGHGYFQATNADLMQLCAKMNARCKLDESGVSTGIAVFRELGFVQTFGQGTGRRLSLVEKADRVELSSSVRYMEGCEELQLFEEFRAWVMSAGEETLLRQFNRPILPSGRC